MNASELKYRIESTGKEPHFFDRSTMRFFGDTMKNFGVRKTVIQSHWTAKGEYSDTPEAREVLELYRRRPVKHGLCSSHYFDAQTFEKVSPAK